MITPCRKCKLVSCKIQYLGHQTICCMDKYIISKNIKYMFCIFVVHYVSPIFIYVLFVKYSKCEMFNIKITQQVVDHVQIPKIVDNYVIVTTRFCRRSHFGYYFTHTICQLLAQYLPHITAQVRFYVRLLVYLIGRKYSKYKAKWHFFKSDCILSTYNIERLGLNPLATFPRN